MMSRLLKMILPVAMALAAVPAFAETDGYGWHGGYMMNGYGHGWLGGLAMLAFWVIVIAVIVLAVRWIGDRRKGEEQSPKALDILKERFARGELDADEYAVRSKALDG